MVTLQRIVVLSPSSLDQAPADRPPATVASCALATSRAAAAMLIAVAMSMSSAAAQSIPIQRILGTGDPMPGSFGLANGLGTPTVDAGEIAYGASDDGAYIAVFKQPAVGGSTTTIVDNQTVIPNSSAAFWQMGTPRIRAGQVLVWGRDRPLIDQGLYFGNGGALGVFADRATSTFTGFSGSATAFDGQNVAFFAADPAAGLFLGTIGSTSYRSIARGNDAIPGDPTATISSFGAPSLRGGWLVFSVMCRDTQTFQRCYAVLRYDLATQVLSTVVGRQDTVPGRGGAFTLIRDAVTDGASIVFAGDQGNPLFGGWSGLCRWRNATLSVLADNSAPLPGSAQPRPVFGGANSGWSVRGDDVVFCAGDGTTGQTMLYALWRGRLVRIAEHGDSLGGGTLDDLWYSVDGFDGRYVGFLGRHGFGAPVSVYVADLACANVESYGAGCHPTGGTPPDLVVRGCPAEGATFALETHGGLGAVTVFVFGIGRTQQPVLGCELLVGPMLPSAFSAALLGGTASLPIGPVSPGSSGIRLTAQALSLDVAASSLASTNGIDFTVY